MVITLTTLETHGELNLSLILLMVLSRTSPLQAHLMHISLYTCAKILSFLVLLVWLGLEHFVDLTPGKDTKLLSMRKEKVLLQQLR